MVKYNVGVEVQLGKYSFLTYDIIAKMVIFKNLGVIDCGIEICPMQSMLPHMSTGIGAFEQVRWDLEHRGIADIDIPVVVLGIEPGSFPKTPDVRQLTLMDAPSRYEVVVRRSEEKGYPPSGLLKKLRDTGLDV